MNVFIYINTWLTDNDSANGCTKYCVAKLNNKPKNMEMGSAGRALRYMASSKSVKHNP